MKTLSLGLAIHNHQPVGNFEWVFEKAYAQAYLPMLEALERHPRVRLALHYSGCLLDWIEAHRPEFISRLASLAARGQVDVMTGGYYEPILPSIPDDDKLGQIAKLTNYVRQRVGHEPTGLWLAERVWEPHLPKVLRQAGVRWVVLDDNHFKRAGLDDESLFGYYLTEEEGATLRLFGTSQQLRYIIPWRSVGEVIGYLQSVASEAEPRIVVMGDDGEKFGIWPQTYERCWQGGWVDELFTAIENSGDWLQTVPPGEYAHAKPPVGRIYLPTASYVEMSEWSLPAGRSYELGKLSHQLMQQGQHDVLQFLSGGFWRNFMVKYSEVNLMHKKMLRVHDKVQHARHAGPGDAGQEELWEGQCNCAYWHGVFGGTYLNHIRSAVFEHLVRAESQAEAVLYGGDNYLRAEKLDYDCDGAQDQVIDGRHQSLSISLDRGGGLMEWDLRRPPYNLTNVMTRRPEGYHRVLQEAESAQAGASAAADQTANIHEVVRVKEQGLSRKLHYDSYTRMSLLDHLLPRGTTPDDFAQAAHSELGNFVGQPYDEVLTLGDGSLGVTLSRAGSMTQGVQTAPLTIEKQIWVPSDRPEVVVHLDLTNTGDQAIEAIFGSEWNLNLLGGSDGTRAFLAVDGKPMRKWSLESIVEVAAEDLTIGNPALEWQLHVRLGSGGKVWCCPLETISNSEAGFERTYQGTTLLFTWPLSLAPAERFHANLSLAVETPPKL